MVFFMFFPGKFTGNPEFPMGKSPWENPSPGGAAAAGHGSGPGQ